MNQVSYASPGYLCPFCALLAGQEHESVWSVPEDIVYQGEGVTALVAAGGPKFNPGHVLVIPDAHYENLYDLPEREGAAIFRLSRAVARAMKAVTGCTGVSTAQHNEPDGNQDVWHLHLHVFPRWSGDALYDRAEIVRSTPAERRPSAQALRQYLEAHPETFQDSERTIP